ncbi:MAG: protein kinase [Planctomycetes bacterium]|nr:protein kinase [Planctomycetota bacterium]MCB9935718.1 protein kinase [Planctomycetota bacterium]
MNENATTARATTEDNDFLVLDSMASMQRVGDSGVSAFFEGGSTLIDLDGVSEERARKAAEEHRDELAHGHHISERYKVIGEIARGGMGAVLEVQDNDLDRRVAMKVLLRDTRKKDSDSGSPLDTGPVNRFIGEAQLTGWLEHPNIVPVHELGLDSQGRVYFTMKRVKGRSLRQIMDKLRQGHAATHAEFPLGKLLTILLKVCDAIDFAHNRGILHRDLKPENIMVGQFGEVLVMDWGLAKQIGAPAKAGSQKLPASETASFTLDVSLGAADEDSRETREGTISGTPAYMAPEQANGNVRELSPRTDIFCLGAILYELLCLVPPYLAANITDALDQARGHALLHPRAKLDKVLKDERLKRAFGPLGIERGRRFPRELVSVCMRAMNEQRELRYHSVADLRRDVEAYMTAQPVSAHRDNPFTALNKWARRNPTRAAVVTLALFFMLLGGVVFAAVRAKVAADRADDAEQTRLAVEAKQEAMKRQLDAEADLRRASVAAKEKAERVAQLEKEALERERRESEALAARNAAFVPYSKGADLRSRSASFTDWGKRAQSWRQAVESFQQALQLDPTFVEAHMELAQVYADLGYDTDALYHFKRADALTASQTGRGHVEALMAYAMYDFQQKALREGIPANFEEVFRRFQPVKDAAEPGSYYARIAQILLDLGDAFRNTSGFEYMRAQAEAARRMAEIEREGPPLWEVYTLLAIIDQGAGDGGGETRDYLRRARELKANLPILTWLQTRQGDRPLTERDRLGLRDWNRFIEQFSYDPRGYYARAGLRFHSADERDAAAEAETAELEIADLKRAIELNPRYADAHKLLLRVYVRQGAYKTAINHMDAMRRSSSGLENSAIDLIEAELTASTGEFDRMRSLVSAALLENVANGTATMAQAAGVLLRDHEYQALIDMCDAVDAQFGQDAPPLNTLFMARGLTMLGRFDQAAHVVKPLEDNPGLLPKEYRPTLANWAEDARIYPTLLSSLTGVPTVRRRFDLGRILALADRDPNIWISLFNVEASQYEEIVTWIYPADYVLKARGQAILARRYSGQRAKALRALAVLDLQQAFEEGYLNRGRILSDEYLAPLITEPALAKYFDVK